VTPRAGSQPHRAHRPLGTPVATRRVVPRPQTRQQIVRLRVPMRAKGISTRSRWDQSAAMPDILQPVGQTTIVQKSPLFRMPPMHTPLAEDTGRSSAAFPIPDHFLHRGTPRLSATTRHAGSQERSRAEPLHSTWAQAAKLFGGRPTQSGTCAHASMRRVAPGAGKGEGTSTAENGSGRPPSSRSQTL
jgi:hypothetical protein